MELETVKLSEIVQRLVPELAACLTVSELEMSIVLRDGLALLEPEDAVEIIQCSICNKQQSVLLH